MSEILSPAYLWIIAGLAVICLELFIQGFVIIFFGLGAVLTGLLLFFVPAGLNMQLALFTALSVLMLTVFRKMARGYFKGRIGRHNPDGLPPETLEGETAVVAETVRPGETGGKVEYNGSFWNAESDIRLEKGTLVRIKGRRDLILLVERNSYAGQPQEPENTSSKGA